MEEMMPTHNKKKLVLIGMPGCGKSTLGAMAAHRLGWPWFDSDEGIEKRQGMTVAEIFARYGEAFFRKIEVLCIRELLHRESPAVISLGGGAVRHFVVSEEQGTEPLIPQALWQDCFFVYVYRSIEDILAQVDLSDRPLVKDNPDRLRELFTERHPLYARLGHVCVHNDGDLQEVDKVVDKIVDGLADKMREVKR